MIYLEKEDVIRLNQLGFKPPYESGEVYAYQFYQYKNEEWSIGGQITGNESMLAPQEVFLEGLRLYTIDEIFDWIHIEGYGMRLLKNIGSGYKFIVFDKEAKEYKGSGGTLSKAIFKTIEKLLMKRKENQS
ncbi:hypothetical protein NV379_23815 [Paenibacillus sp. N1-5-1-14]|uniref:hypothetical protein n=1 Tax=Paenibacillus radicibacter TaxID=2972488 RepID=UPI0021597F32|nr:hypothetical protein [Paenibacillus radicibacter]MCR8645672.1 hypothetical protein [Paenibacillus radicibacter]